MPDQTSLVTIAVLTSAGGEFSSTFIVPAGRLLQYRYVPHASVPLDTGADIDLVGATTGKVYINQDNIGTAAYEKVPRMATHDETAAASFYAAAGEPVEDFIYTGGEDLTFTVAQGGNAKQGTFYFWIG
jgi:hypothetical protein